MYRPVLPLSGNGGWRFLQATYDRQLAAFARSPEVRADRAYLTERLSRPLSTDEFLGDRRLLRTALTAFDLGGEEWKRGFIAKVLSEAAKPESTFLARLNNPKYTSFANAFRPVNGEIRVSASARADLGSRFEAAGFEVAVGAVDDSMRLALNFKGEIGDLVATGSSDRTVLFRLLGNVPVRRVLETAIGLPTDIRKLPIDRQADLLKARLDTRFGVRDLASLKDPAVIERILGRFHALNTVAEGTAQSGAGVSALGSLASQNLFLSRL